MRLALTMMLALAVAASSAGCAEKASTPAAVQPAPDAADNWEPGKDLAGTQVVIGGVAQEIPADAVATKRKMDAVAAGYEAQMDELERERQKKFAADADLRP